MASSIGDHFRFDSEAHTSPRRLAIVIGAGAALLLATLWLFSGDNSQPADPAPAAPPTVAPTPPSASSEADATASGASAAQIVLHGVMGLGTDGSAIISVGGGAQRLVRTGRDIIPGLPLVAVAGNHIVVRERGQDVQIGFPDRPVSPAIASGEGASRPAASPEASDPALAREAIEYQAALQPFQQDGRHRGFQIRAGTIPPDFAAAGLRPGDVVLRVAGSQLETADEVAEIPRRMRLRDRIAIVFLRDGAERTVYFERSGTDR